MATSKTRDHDKDLGKDHEKGDADRLTAADVAKLIEARVRVVITKKGDRTIEDRAATDADILSFAVRDGKVSVVTVDGRKHEVPLP